MFVYIYIADKMSLLSYLSFRITYKNNTLHSVRKLFYRPFVVYDFQRRGELYPRQIQQQHVSAWNVSDNRVYE